MTPRKRAVEFELTIRFYQKLCTTCPDLRAFVPLVSFSDFITLALLGTRRRLRPPPGSLHIQIAPLGPIAPSQPIDLRLGD